MMRRFILPGVCLAIAGTSPAALDLPRLVFRNGKAGFIAGDGRLLAAPRYQVAGNWSEGRIWVQERDGNTRSGRFLDELARPLPAAMEMRNLAGLLPEQPLPRFQRGLAVVGLADGAYGYVNREGRLLGRTSRAGAFLRQDDPLLLIVESGRVGYMDRDGNVKIAPRFDDARPFRGGRAPAAEAGRWGLIDESGAWVAKPMFDDLWWFADEPRVWNYRLKDKRGLLHRDGALLTEARFDDFGVPCGDVISVCQENRWGLVSVGGQLCFAPRYAVLEPPPPAATCQWWRAKSAEGRWGLVGTNGVELLPCVYERIEVPAPGCWVGWSEGCAGLLDPVRGGFRDEARYERLVPLAPDASARALALRRGGWGVIDLATGQVLLPFEYARLMPWGSWMAGERGAQVQLLDATNAVLQEWDGKLDGLPGFNELVDGVGVVHAAAGYTLIQADGHRPLTMSFEAAGKWGGGVWAVQQNGRWGFVGRNGAWSIEPQFDAVGAFYGTAAPACQNGRWGLIDRRGKWLLKPRFEVLERPWNGLYPARRGGLWGLIDGQGKEVLACEYEGLEWGTSEFGESLWYGWEPSRHSGFDHYGRGVSGR
jgi:hypothetical protein